MPSELVERMARAIWDVYQASPIVTEGSAGLTWDDLLRIAEKPMPLMAASKIVETARAEARAALMATRQPTEAQAKVMDEALGSHRPPTRRWHWVWQEMIDTELNA
jgi:hypothetical protein